MKNVRELIKSELPGLNVPSLNYLNLLLNELDTLNGEELKLKSRTLYEELLKQLSILDSVNKKGYINNPDLTTYPLFSECVELLLFFRDEKERKNAMEKITDSVKIGSYYLKYTTGKFLFK
jgi:hypothetical protein